jgi:hypothetical protein
LIKAKCYDRAAIFTRVSKVNPSLVSQYRSGQRAITERTVFVIEEAFNTPGWFAAPEGTGVSMDADATPIPSQPQFIARPITHGRNAWLDQSKIICDYLDALQPEEAEMMLVVFVAQLKFEAVKASRLTRAGDSVAKAARAA